MNTNNFRNFGLIGVFAIGVIWQSALPAEGFAGKSNRAQDAAQHKSNAKGMLHTAQAMDFSSQGTNGEATDPSMQGSSMGSSMTGSSVMEADSEITQVTTEEGLGGEAVITIESSKAIQYTAFKLMNPLRLVLDFPKTGKGTLTDRIDVNKGVVDSIRPLHFDEAGVLRLEIALNNTAGYNIQKPVKNRIVITLKQVDQGGTLPVNADQGTEQAEDGSGESKDASKALLAEDAVDPCLSLLGGDKDKISLDFQDADVRNLFRIFSEISGFNLILSPEVSGTVNMRLLDVPWNEAFEIILTNSALGKECLGENIIRVASLRTLASEEDQKVEDNKRKRAKELSEKLAAELVTEVKRVNYADIKEVALSLETLKSERGKITVDVRTNTLVLTDIRENVDDMTNLVQVLDIQTPQVMIEARIVEVNKSLTQQLGVQWGITSAITRGGGGRIVNALDSPNNGNGSPFLVDLLPGGTALAEGAFSGINLGLGGLIEGTDLNVVLTALEKKGDARILSSPKVTTLDNKEARIKSGRSIPFQTSSANEGTKIEFVDADLSLTVTPHITTDDYIYMVIDATKNAPNTANLIAGFPEITTKEAHTEVLVENGDTTVLGGIYESDIKRNQEATPFLSKIPFFGALFRNIDDADQIDELLIFITPTVVSNDQSKNL